MDERESEQPANGGAERTHPGEDNLPPADVSRDWLRILQRVTEGAMAHLDLRELLQDLLGRIREAMAVDNAAILLLSDDQNTLIVYAARGPEEQVTGKVQVPVGRGVVGRIAATAAPLIVDDLAQVEVENPLLRETVRSLVGVPLIARGQVIGVIHVDSVQLRRFTKGDSDLLQVIADRVALAVEHAQLYEAERAARREANLAAHRLQTLQTVSDIALEHMRLHELLPALLDRIRLTMRVDNVAILLPTPDGSELTLYSVRGPEAAVMGQVHVPMGQGVAGTIAATRSPLVVENLETVPVSNPFLREHFTSLLGVPLLAGGRLVGVIHVDSVQLRHFTEEETRLLEVMAERIAVAIDRARLFESTEQSREEAQHRATELQETTDRMDEFLSIASHELRTPLTSLKTNVQMLDYWLTAQRGQRADETGDEYVQRATKAVRPLVRRSIQSVSRLNRLISDLLDASRVRENRLDLRRQRTDLVTIVREAIEEQSQAHPSRRLVFEERPATAVPVLADADRIGQVVANYISNALKFSTSEHPVTVRVQPGSAFARVLVRDQGVGIPAAEHAHIWERFYRVASIGHQSGSEVGLGLGLYISRDIVERHGGAVGVESAPGQGSTFWFTVPLAPRGQKASSAHGEHEVQRPDPGKREGEG